MNQPHLRGEETQSTTTQDTGVTVLCPECGDLLEVHDPRSLILTLHQRNECPQTSGLFGQGSGE